MARRSLRVATYLRCTLLTRPEHDMCRRSQILRIYWALSTHACAASSRDGATAAFLTGRRSKLRTGTLFNFHAKDGSVNSVVAYSHFKQGREPRIIEYKGFCLCASLHPCVCTPLCTPVYPCVPLCIVPLCTVLYPCVQYPCPAYSTPCVPLVYPCVALVHPCVRLCAPVFPRAPMCTPVYPADPFVHLCTPVCAHVYPCVCTVPCASLLCTPVTLAPPKKENPPPPPFKLRVLQRATPTSDVEPPPNVPRRRRASRGTAHIGCLGACVLLRGGRARSGDVVAGRCVGAIEGEWFLAKKGF